MKTRRERSEEKCDNKETMHLSQMVRERERELCRQRRRVKKSEMMREREV